MSQQGLQQASVRAVTGTAGTYEGDWHALFDLDSIPVGDFDARLLAWINYYLGAAYTNLPEAMQAFATAQGAFNWSSMGTFNASVVSDARITTAGDYRITTGGDIRIWV